MSVNVREILLNPIFSTGDRRVALCQELSQTVGVFARYFRKGEHGENRLVAMHKVDEITLFKLECASVIVPFCMVK